MNGFIDRVDCAEIDGEKWLKVVDYKTGSKSFDLANIYNGYQLQLPLYTKMLLDLPEFKGYNVAAMEYFLAGVPKLEQGQEIDTPTLADNFKRKGLFVAEVESVEALDSTEGGLYNNAHINKDGSFASRAPVASRQEIDQLGEFVKKKTKSIMERMVSGDVSVCPMKQGVNACRYCKFDGICRFEYGKNKLSS